MGLISPGGQNLLDFLELRQVLSTYDDSLYPGSIPGLGRFPGEGKVYPLQYSGLENSMDCIVHGGCEELEMTERRSLYIADGTENFLRGPGENCNISYNLVL